MSNARNIANLPNGDDAPVYACRAWVNFDGTLDENQLSLTTGENVYIRDAGNVSSVYYNGTGKYQVNLTTAMPDTNYSVVVDGAFDTGDSAGTVVHGLRRAAFSTNSVKVRCFSPHDNTFNDSQLVTVAIFR